MADQTGGSPWNEPMPEATEPKKSQPTVIGDLNVGNQTAAPATNQAAPASKQLNVPKNVAEPVGAQVDAASIAPQPVQAPAPVQPRPVPLTYDVKPAPQPAAAAKPSPDMSHLYQPVPMATPAPAAPQAPAVNQPPAQVPLHPATAAPAAGKSKPSGSKTKVIMAVIFGLIILFAGGIFLTESGMISIGLEKVYGLARLETLWKGLPANPENAFAVSAVKMKSQSNFKVTGSAIFTVNKSVKSNLISPIVSATAFPVLALSSDQSVSGIKALLTAVESDLTSDIGSNSPETDSSESSSGSIATPPTASSLNTSGSGASSIVSNQEVTANISAKFNNDISGTTIDLKTSKNPKSKIELVYAKDKLYLKSSSNIVYDPKVLTGWISYDLAKNNIDAPSATFWGSSFSGSNFSLTGSRVGNEKINGVRCYHYSGKANIAGALSAFGLSENSVQSLDFDFWSGVADQRIYQLKMKIIPNANAAISRIDLQLNFSDFGNEGDNYYLPATSTPSSGSKSSQTSLNTSAARDSQRKSDLATIAKALDDYRQAYNTYPPATKNEKIAAGSGTLFENLVPTFISKLPLDPEDPKYYYGYESDGRKYTLSAVLEDKADSEGKAVGGKNIYFLKSQ